MSFLTEPPPPRGQPLPVLPGIRRIVANNPGPMTYHGTNTYLIDTSDGVVVLDPGPDLPAHVMAILDATGGKIAWILLSHTHVDHVGGLRLLQRATGAPTAGSGLDANHDVVPDRKLADGDVIAGLIAVHTPGHAPDHLCFGHATPDGRSVLFSADHVMSWSTSVINPPKGDMAAYFASLRRLLGQREDLYLPGHGPPLPEPRRVVEKMLAHRQAREDAIMAALKAFGTATTSLLTETVYAQAPATLRRAAERSVLAHLLKLETERRAARHGEAWRAA